MDKLYSYFLQSPAYPATEVADYLYDISGVGPVDEAALIYESCKQKIHDLIYGYLDLDDFKGEDGKFVNELPTKYDIDLVERIEAEYQEFIDGHDLNAMLLSAEDSILRRVEIYAWNHGLTVLPEAIDGALANISACSVQYHNMCEPVDSSALIQAHGEAYELTFIERISGKNADDILMYRQDLIEYLEKKCAVRMYEFFERFFSILSCSSVIMDIQMRLADMVAYLKDQGVAEVEKLETELPQDFFDRDIRVFTANTSSEPQDIIKDAYSKLAEIWN